MADFLPDFSDFSFSAVLALSAVDAVSCFLPSEPSFSTGFLLSALSDFFGSFTALSDLVESDLLFSGKVLGFSETLSAVFCAGSLVFGLDSDARSVFCGLDSAGCFGFSTGSLLLTLACAF